MATDPSIPLQVRNPQINYQGLGQTLGSLALMQDRAAQVEQRRRALEDDAAVRAALQTSQTPDQAIDVLYQQGRANAAQNLSKAIYSDRKAKADAASAELTRQQKALGMAAQIAASADDQKSWDGAFNAISALNLSPQVMAMIPKEYDRDEQQKLVTMGLSAKDQLTQRQQAIANHMKAQEIALQAARDADQHQKNLLDARPKYTLGAAQLLSTTRSQGDLDRDQALLVKAGTPTDIVAQFGNTWTPDFPKRAMALGMTPAQRTTAARDAALTQQGDERNRIAADRLAFERNGPAGGRYLTPGERATAERFKSEGYSRLEKEFRNDQTNFGADGQPTADALQQLGQDKLQVENSYRAQIGLPSLEDAEAIYATTPGREKDLAIVQNRYKAVTGKQAPIASLMTSIRRTTDPRIKAGLVKQLLAIRARYSGTGQEDNQ